MRSSDAKVKKGDVIRVAYVGGAPAKPVLGPAPIPVLIEGVSYQMYLARQVGAVGGLELSASRIENITYAPAARGASFVRLAEAVDASGPPGKQPYAPPTGEQLRECQTKFAALQGQYPATSAALAKDGQAATAPIVALGAMRPFGKIVENAARNGTRFGGRYALDYFGCGSGCTRSVIVDLVDRVAFAGPVDVYEPLTSPVSRVILTRPIDPAAPDPAWEFGFALPAAYLVEKRSVRHLLTCPEAVNRKQYPGRKD